MVSKFQPSFDSLYEGFLLLVQILSLDYSIVCQKASPFQKKNRNLQSDRKIRIMD